MMVHLGDEIEPGSGSEPAHEKDQGLGGEGTVHILSLHLFFQETWDAYPHGGLGERREGGLHLEVQGCQEAQTSGVAQVVGIRPIEEHHCHRKTVSDRMMSPAIQGTGQEKL